MMSTGRSRTFAATMRTKIELKFGINRIWWVFVRPMNEKQVTRLSNSRLPCFSCGGPTRTGDLQVMSLASYQLLHSAMFLFSFAGAKVRISAQFSKCLEEKLDFLPYICSRVQKVSSFSCSNQPKALLLRCQARTLCHN